MKENQLLSSGEEGGGGGGNLFIILIYFFLARTIWKNVFCIPALKSPRSSSRKEDAYP